MQKIYFIGTGPGDLAYCTRIGYDIICDADCLIGPERLLEQVRVAAELETPCVAWPHGLDAMADTVLRAAADYAKVAVLATGDSNLYSIAGYMSRRLKNSDRFETVLIPGISSLQYFLAKLQIPQDKVSMVSLHGRMKGFSLERFREGGGFVYFTEPEHGPRFLAELLLREGLGDVELVIGEALSLPDEKISRYAAKDLPTRDFHELTLVYIDWPVPETTALSALPEVSPLRRYGLPDSVFQRGDRPMTKQIVRLTALNLLDIPDRGVFWDIGAGTGSIALEVGRAHPDLDIYAVEKEPSGIELLKENVQRFGLRNIQAVEGKASAVMDDLPVCQRCFIGGSGGEMEKIFETLAAKFDRVADKGNLLNDPVWQAVDGKLKVAVSAVTLATPVKALEAAKRHGFDLVDTYLLSVAKGRKLGPHVMENAENPVRLLLFERSAACEMAN